MKLKTLFLFLLPYWVSAQGTNLKELSYNEFLGYVKKYHPLVKSASLEVSSAQANLMIARGGFDPKIEIDYDKKQFNSNKYYSILNSSFKIPTWYGIEVKAGFDNNEGVFLNPQNSMPNNGLASIGINIPLSQGLFINQRMADVRKAKMQISLSRAEQKLQAIAVLFDGSVAYFNWKRNYSEVSIYESFVQNAETRLGAVRSLIFNGDKPGIDSVEAGIILRSRQLNLEEAKLKLAKSTLELANFLWLDNDVPLELQDDIVPEADLALTIQETLKINEQLQTNFSLETHPKISLLKNKIDMLNIDRQLKANAMLPQIDVGYQHLSRPKSLGEANFNNYKVGVNFYFPIFLRKERGNLQIVKLKIQDTQYDLNLERVQLTNKINAQQTEINSLEKQRKLISILVSDYNTMLGSEERLFSFGESSVFLINTRENNLINAKLSKLVLENRYFISNAELFRTMANPD